LDIQAIFIQSGINQNGGFYDFFQYVEHYQQPGAIHFNMDRPVFAGAVFCTTAISPSGHVV
jgi:hypothetical protein